MTIYAYLHGFGSGPEARKAVELRADFARLGLALRTPNLAVPSFAKLTLTAALAVIANLGDDADRQGEKLALIGSSMGGLLAALYAAGQAPRVSHLVLLCPGFDMAARFRGLVGERGMERWRREDRTAYPDAAGTITAVHYGLYEDALLYPPFPAPPPGVPVTILHGIHDTVVPIEVSRRYVASHPQVTLYELDDEHRLHASIPEVLVRVREAFGLPVG